MGRPEVLIVDDAPGLEKAIAAVWDGVPIQRCTLAHAPERLHEEIGADYTDMIHGATPKQIEARRKALPQGLHPQVGALHPPVADSLEEPGDRLFAFTRLPPSQWRSAWTTDEIERLHEDFKRRIKTQHRAAVCRHRRHAVLGVIAPGQNSMRKVDGCCGTVATTTVADMGSIPGSLIKRRRRA